MLFDHSGNAIINKVALASMTLSVVTNKYEEAKTL